MSESDFEKAGWQLCDFDGEDGECDNCGQACNPTYYQRTVFDVDEGDYMCAECIKREIKILKRAGMWP